MNNMNTEPNNRKLDFSPEDTRNSAEAEVPPRKPDFSPERIHTSAEAEIPLWKPDFSPEEDALPSKFKAILNHTPLPHLDLHNYHQFITFRTYDSVDLYLKKLQAQENINNSEHQLAIDEYLDQSKAGAYLNNDTLILFSKFMKEKNTILYNLVAFCIMPNHVHLLMKPLDKLAVVMRKLKGGSAHLLNDSLNRSGKFWATNYYDKLIRSEKQFSIVYQYIKNNPNVLHESKTLPTRFYGIYETPAQETGLQSGIHTHLG